MLFAAVHESGCAQIVLQKSPRRSCRIKIRNNRIGTNGFLNQRCALTPDLESILRTQTGKILLQQNRHIPAVATAAKDGRSRLESGRWRSAARWLPERELSEKAPGVWLGSQMLGVRAARQAHREHRALAWLARYCHVAAHHARELAREGKAEPRPAVAPRGQGLGLGELLEQLRLL